MMPRDCFMKEQILIPKYVVFCGVSYWHVKISWAGTVERTPLKICRSRCFPKGFRSPYDKWGLWLRGDYLHDIGFNDPSNLIEMVQNLLFRFEWHQFLLCSEHLHECFNIPIKSELIFDVFKLLC